MKKIIGIIMSVFLVVAVSITIYMVTEKQIFKKEKPEELIVKYMKYIEKKEYDAMYSMIETNSQNSLTKENFINRNSKIYEGMEVRNLKVDSVKLENHESKNVTVSYNTSFETIAGKVSFRNKAIFTDTEDGYKMLWDDSLIFPELEETDKIQVSTMQAERGEITDRNGKVLAGKGIASSVGIVPGKLKDRDDLFKKLAKLLNIDAKTIKSKLGAKWVKDDSFVPITTIPKVSEQDLMKLEPDNEVLKEQKRQEKLLDISGVMLSDTEVRSYTLGEAASHLIGYVQSVTAEDLEKHQGEGYSSNSVIGRSGIEGLFEKELKGQDGYEICIVDEEGKSKKTIAEITEEDGEDIQLTIDSDLQKSLYEQFKKDKGCSVAMN